MIYVKDVDSVFKQAIAAGGKEQRPVVDQFYGDRSGTLVDPFGHVVDRCHARRGRLARGDRQAASRRCRRRVKSHDHPATPYTLFGSQRLGSAAVEARSRSLGIRFAASTPRRGSRGRASRN